MLHDINKYPTCLIQNAIKVHFFVKIIKNTENQLKNT